MDNFITLALRTEAPPPSTLTSRQGRLLHAALGFVTEAGEFADAVKKHLYYDKPLDETNCKEEIGDLLWYMAIALDELGSDLNEEEARVIRKLMVRYPSKFEAEAAQFRDLVVEREVLETQPTFPCSHFHVTVTPDGMTCSRCGAKV